VRRARIEGMVDAFQRERGASMNGDRNPTMGAVEWILLLILSILWGGSFFFAKLGVSALPPLVVVFLRVAIAAATLVAALVALGRPLPKGARLWAALAAMGLFNNVIPFALIFWAQTHIPSGLAAIINATTPLFSTVVAQLAAGQERLTPGRGGGVIVGVAGVAAMMAPNLAEGRDSDILAELACVGAAVSYAVAGVFGRRYFRGVAPLATAAGQLTASSVIMLPVVLLAVPDATSLRPDTGVIAAVIALALISTALAYVIYFRILATAGATNILLVTLLIPVSAILLGGAFLGERLEARHLLGMAAIAIGLGAIDGRPLAFLRRRFGT
jgi:drug/metabolite transporter (DMT)-like permease